MVNLKQWLIESINLTKPEDLNNFLDHAIIVCIKTHHKLQHSQLKTEIINLTDLLENIQKKVKTHIVNQPLVDDKFKPKTLSLDKNEYSHRFPDFKSILKALSTLGSNHMVDKKESIELTAQLKKIYSFEK